MGSRTSMSHVDTRDLGLTENETDQKTISLLERELNWVKGGGENAGELIFLVVITWSKIDYWLKFFQEFKKNNQIKAAELTVVRFEECKMTFNELEGKVMTEECIGATNEASLYGGIRAYCKAYEITYQWYMKYHLVYDNSNEELQPFSDYNPEKLVNFMKDHEILISRADYIKKLAEAEAEESKGRIICFDQWVKVQGRMLIPNEWNELCKINYKK